MSRPEAVTSIHDQHRRECLGESQLATVVEAVIVNINNCRLACRSWHWEQEPGGFWSLIRSARARQHGE